MIYTTEEIKERRTKIEHDIFQLKQNLNLLWPRLRCEFTSYYLGGEIQYDVHELLLYTDMENEEDDNQMYRAERIIQGNSYEEWQDGDDEKEESIVFESDYPLEILRIIKYFEPRSDHDCLSIVINGDVIDYNAIEQEFYKVVDGQERIIPYFNLTDKVPYMSEDWIKLNELVTGFNGLDLVYQTYKSYNQHENDKRTDSGQERNGHE